MTIVEPEAPVSPPPASLPTNSLAIASLISGILAWLGVFGVGGILAVIFGHMAKKEIRNNLGAQTGDGLATAGLVLGYLNIAIAVVAVCVVLAILGGGLAMLGLSLPNQ